MCQQKVYMIYLDKQASYDYNFYTMSAQDAIGNRMKDNYESIYSSIRLLVVFNKPVILMIGL